MVKMYNQMNKAPVKQAKRRICENLVTTCLKGKMYTPQPVDKNHLVNALLLCCCSHSLNGSYLQTLPSCSLSCSESAKCVTQTGIGLCHTFSHSTEANLSLWQWTFSIFMLIVSKSLQTNTKKRLFCNSFYPARPRNLQIHCHPVRRHISFLLNSCYIMSNMVDNSWVEIMEVDFSLIRNSNKKEYSLEERWRADYGRLAISILWF